MATGRGKDDKGDLSPDELAPAPDEASGAIVVTGILGDSPNPDSVRLYLDLAFTKLYEIPREAIIRRTALPAAQSPLGVDSSALLVRKGTVLTLQSVDSRRIEDEFLAGDFTAPGSFDPQPALGAHAVVGRTRNVICLGGDATELRCPTEAPLHCNTSPIRCRTEVSRCFTPCGGGEGTRFPPCPTQGELLCPSSQVCSGRSTRIECS